MNGVRAGEARTKRGGAAPLDADPTDRLPGRAPCIPVTTRPARRAPVPKEPLMRRVFDWAGQALLYGCFAVAIGVFSRWPAYHPLPPDMAQIKVSFIHHGARLADCRPYTAEELAKLAPNMRKATKCERERSPVSIEVDLDGRQVVSHVSAPS